MDTRYSERVAASVSEAMSASGMSPRALSDATGIPRTTLLRRIRSNGQSAFTLAELEAVAVALGMPVLDLLNPSDAA